MSLKCSYHHNNPSCVKTLLTASDNLAMTFRYDNNLVTSFKPLLTVTRMINHITNNNSKAIDRSRCVNPYHQSVFTTLPMRLLMTKNCNSNSESHRLVHLNKPKQLVSSDHDLLQSLMIYCSLGVAMTRSCHKIS